MNIVFATSILIIFCIIGYTITSFKDSVKAYYWMILAIILQLAAIMQQQQELICLLKK